MKPGELSLGHRLPAMPRAGRVLFSLLSRLQFGRVELTTPEGERLVFNGEAPGAEASLRINDWAVCADILKAGDIGFAEAFLSRRWETSDLAALLEVAARNRAALERALHGKWWGTLLYRLRHLIRSNTRGNARRNIHAHYDLGNEFYRAWLDGTMSYSSAMFEGKPERGLEQSQLAKYRRILDQLDVQPGDRILEIGCGWGGFAEVAARERGASVHGITLSNEQLRFCRERFNSAGIEHQVSAQLCDYRDVKGQFDFVVSIEMFEAVGEAYWAGYFGVVRDRLRQGGRALIQTIVIADELFDSYRRGTDFIQQYVFPGGMLPSSAGFARHAAAAGLSVSDRYFFGLDYAQTLRIWRERYNQAAPSLKRLGFDDRFERLWNFYLAYCEAGFRAGSIDVAQMELTHD
ncbi:MAG: cyclopropane-fatty-acyl-phospholipid synthase [Betaproteobacteria bacterium SG8_40]|jgi:cyclopropane-fatty-acyl-phospholipid synthase|nr:MAG: cyclopropane-fatty-acyl-phospholipid synthase [Betaproteobacteria bacterium SG8_40]